MELISWSGQGEGNSSFTPNPPQVWAWQDTRAPGSQGAEGLFFVVLGRVGGSMAEISAPSFIQHQHRPSPSPSLRIRT